MDRIIQHLKNSHRILVASHANPDGDALGSLIAMGLSLKALDKSVTLYNESPVPAVYRFLPKIDLVEHRFGSADEYDTAVILDCGDLDRIGEAASAVSRVPLMINIDHHVTNTGFGHYQYIDTSASATAEILYRLIKKMGVPFNKDIATLIYTGILTDTGSFRFSNTNLAAFTICEEMVDIGVEPYNIAKYVYGTYSLGRLKLLNLALDSIELSKNGKLSMMTLKKHMFSETNTHPEDVDGMINYAKRIEDVKVAVLIQEDLNGADHRSHPSLYHVSLRSDGTVDVAKIAANLGGGGHFSAAGFSTESTLEELKSKLFHLAEIL
jgi:bifunctional oligoribonuclease and PAP phosphatase NrnA